MLLLGCGSSGAQSAGPKGGADTMGTGGTGGDPPVTGGNSTSGGGAPPKPPAHVVVPCDSAEVGVWEEITPPDVLASPVYSSGQGYGINAFVMDGSNHAIITLGTDKLGIYRTEDCGATWKPINTGRGAATMSGGAQWSMAVDPITPDTIYTVAGYGTNGVFKTTNGGVDWDQTLAPEYAKNFVFGGFTAQIRVVPDVAGNVLITPHFTCENGHSEVCFQQTTDGGNKWTVIEGAPSGGEGARLFLESKDVWFSGVGFGGLFRSANAGATWTRLTDPESYAFEVFHRPGGKYYLPVAFGVSASDDGVTWETIPGSPGAHVITTSDTRIYAGTGGHCVLPHAEPFNPISSAPIDDPTNWTVDTTYSNRFGAGELQYDIDHHMLYASSCTGGFWRVRTQ